MLLRHKVLLLLLVLRVRLRLRRMLRLHLAGMRQVGMLPH